jgi:6-phosphogluconate dehydrogenase
MGYMKIGIIGTGKMGTGIALRLHKAGYTVVLYDIDILATQTLSALINAPIADNISDLVSKVSVIWLMVPAGKPVDDIFDQLLPLVQPHHLIIDGGNSYFLDSIKRAQELQKKNCAFLDCGTSGGLYGTDSGFSLTIGGETSAFSKCEDIFKTLSMPHGYLHTGPSGSGHYVKMVHNGIEYGLLQAYAEGMEILHDGYFKNLNLAAITCTWRHGAVIDSFILKLLNTVLERHINFQEVVGIIGRTGTGDWTAQEAEKHTIAIPVIQAALDQRIKSEKNPDQYAHKIVALLRNQLGGHPVVTRNGVPITVHLEEPLCHAAKGHNIKKSKENL